MQRISTPSVIEIKDQKILAEEHLLSLPAVTFLYSDITTDTIFKNNTFIDNQAVYLAGDLPISITEGVYFIRDASPTSFKLKTALDVTVSFSSFLNECFLTSTFFSNGNDPWSEVLTKLVPYIMDDDKIGALRNSLNPSNTNELITFNHQRTLISGAKAFLLVGNVGSNADYMGADQDPFVQAMAALPSGGLIVVLPGTYTFTDTLVVTNGIRMFGTNKETVIFNNTGNFNTVHISNGSLVYSVNIRGDGCTSTAALKMSGTGSYLTNSLINNFGFLGIQLGGTKNRVLSTHIESSALGSYGVWLQDTYNSLLHSRFGLSLSGGAVKFEGKACGVVACYFENSLTGYGYEIGHQNVEHNRLVGNFFESASSVLSSVDNGSGTIRYGNVPNSLTTLNKNNLLDPLKVFTGQPSITSANPVFLNDLVTDASHTSLTAKIDNVGGLPSLDKAVQAAYVSRNYFLTNTSPVYDTTGIPTADFFNWDGSILSVPNFQINHAIFSSQQWLVTPNTYTLASGEYLYVDLATAPTNSVVTPVVTTALPIVLGNTQFLVIAANLGNGSLLWFPNYGRIPVNSTFDVDGHTLPLTRFVGIDETRNSGIPFSGFSGASNSNLTAKLSTQSRHLKSLYDRANTLTETSVLIPANFDGPTPGNDGALSLISSTTSSATIRLTAAISESLVTYQAYRSLLPNISTVSDILANGTVQGSSFTFNTPTSDQVLSGLTNDTYYTFNFIATDAFGKKSAYNMRLMQVGAAPGLAPALPTRAVDSYVSTEPSFNRWLTSPEVTTGLPSTPTHVIQVRGTSYCLAGSLYRYERASNAWSLIPLIPVGSYTSLSKLNLGIAVLTTLGDVLYYDIDTNLWTTFAPILENKLSNIIPFASSRSVTFIEGGQADFSLQTKDHTFFTTLDGLTVRYSFVKNSLELCPKVFTSSLDERLFSQSLKNPGYNTLRDPLTLWDSGDTGASYTVGLPNGERAKLLVKEGWLYNEMRNTNFTSLLPEVFDYEADSGNLIYVSKNSAGTKYFVFGGGKGTATFYNTIDTADLLFVDFTISSWIANATEQEIVCLGFDNTNAFTVIIGSPNAAGVWTWVKQVLGAPSTCYNAYGLYENHLDSIETQTVHVLVSDGTHPRWWQRKNGVWSFKRLTSTIATGDDVLVPNATSGSYLASGTAKGASSVTRIMFGISNSNAPKIIDLTKSTGTYTLRNVSNSVVSSYGNVTRVTGATFSHSHRDFKFLYTHTQAGAPFNSGWKRVTNSVNQDLKSVAYVLGSTLIAVAVGNAGTVIRTTDGGETWSNIAVSTGATLNSVAFFSSTVGLFVGNFDSSAVVFRTTDAGLTWTRVTGLPSFSYYHVTTNSSSCLICGSGSSYLRSSDSGASFSAFTAPLSSTDVISGGFFLDGTAVISQGSNVYRSTNFLTGNPPTFNQVGGEFNFNFIYADSVNVNFFALTPTGIKKSNGGSLWSSLSGHTSPGNHLTVNTDKAYQVGNVGSYAFAGTTGGSLHSLSLNSVAVSSNVGLIVGSQGYILKSVNNWHTIYSINDNISGESSALLLGEATKTVAQSSTWLTTSHKSKYTVPFNTSSKVWAWTDSLLEIPVTKTTSTSAPVFSVAQNLNRSSLNTSVFSRNNTYQLNMEQTNDGSFQVASLCEADLTTTSAGIGYTKGTGLGTSWGTAGLIKNVAQGIFVGLNRNSNQGLWIANSNLNNKQVEYFSSLNGSGYAVGDVEVPSLGLLTNFDWAINSTHLLISYLNTLDNKGKVFVYTLATGAVSNVSLGTMVHASMPRIAYNPVANSWDVVVQDNNRQGGQLVFYRSVNNGTSFTEETVGNTGANKLLASMLAQAGKSPSKPLIAPNGDVIVACEHTVNNHLLIATRLQVTQAWTSTAIATVGFLKPEITVTGTTYFAFGTSNGTNASIAASNGAYLTGWGVVTNTHLSYYQKFTNISVYGGSDYVAVASPINAGADMGVVKIDLGYSLKCSSFSGKGASSTGETNFSNPHFNYDGSLSYTASYPATPASIFPRIRISRTKWDATGDSILGAGRLLTIGSVNFRENYSSDNQPLIEEYSTTGLVKYGNNLPLAEKETSKYVQLRWPVSADTLTSLLFMQGTLNVTSPENNLQGGLLPAVTSRGWPTIVGGTKISGGAGASVLDYGSMLILSSPLTTNNLSYFGSTSVGSDGIFKLKAKNVLTFYGSWKFSTGLKSFRLNGPVSFDLDSASNGSHLVMNFPENNLVLDSNTSPLTYWTNLDFSQTAIPIVIGEKRDDFFLLYLNTKTESDIIKLRLGALEPREISANVTQIGYRAPAQYSPKFPSRRFEVAPLDIDSVFIKTLGDLEGIQKVNFPLISGEKFVLCINTPPDNRGYYLLPTNFSYATASSSIRQIVGRYGSLVVFEG